MSRRPAPALGNRVRKVPLSYPDQVQLSAVLRPLLVDAVGPQAALRDRAEIVRQTAWTRLRWRRAAASLAGAGWGTLGADGPRRSLGNAIKCPVAFVMTVEKKGRPCKLAPCPFCWARQVRKVWLRIDRAFFPPQVGPPRRRRTVDLGPDSGSPEEARPRAAPQPAHSPFDLYDRVQVFRMGAAATVHYCGQEFRRPALEVFMASRSSGKPPRVWRRPEVAGLLAAAGPGAGLLEGVRFRRYAGDDPLYTWEVVVRQLLLVPAGADVPPRFSRASVPELRRHRRVRGPSRKLVCALVARALRYEPELLNPPVETAVAMLDACTGRKRVATFGSLRGMDI